MCVCVRTCVCACVYQSHTLRCGLSTVSCCSVHFSRFLQDEASNSDKFSYVPFGAGMRSTCVLCVLCTCVRVHSVCVVRLMCV